MLAKYHKRRHDIQHNDSQHKDTQYNGLICEIQHNYTKHNSIEGRYI